MKISKKYLELLAILIKEAELNLSDARLRDSVFKQLVSHLEDFGEAKKKIIETFCNKDEEGKPLIEDNKYSFKTEVIENLNKEFDVLVQEEVELKLDDTDKLKEIIEKTSYKPKTGEVEQIDTIISLIK